MIALLFGLAFLAGIVGVALCVFGFIYKLPFDGRQRATYWMLAGTTTGFAVFAALLGCVEVAT